MINQELAKLFYEIADALALQGDQWRPIAYRRAAASLNSIEDVRNIYKKKGIAGLMEIPGVGEAIAKKIEEYIKTGKIKHHDELVGKLPKEIAAISHISTLGIKRAKKLYKKLGIKTIAQLKKAAEEGKIRELESFGEKSEKLILEGIKLFEAKGGRRLPLKQIMPIVRRIKRRMLSLPCVESFEVAGSIRRKKATIGDIDTLVISKEPEKVMDAFCSMPDVKRVLAKGPTKSMILLKNNLQADIRVVPPESFGGALQYFTGDVPHNIALRKIAIKKGYKLNEYGLFDRKTGRLVAGKTEEEIYKKLGVKFLPPEKRVGEESVILEK